MSLYYMVSAFLRAQEVSPIIDMHLHAHTLSMYGTPPPAVCTNDQEISFPGLDPREPMIFARVHSCARAVESAQRQTRNSGGACSRCSSTTISGQWRRADWRRSPSGWPQLLIGSFQQPHLTITRRESQRPFGAYSLKEEFAVFAEISSQYNGLSPADPSLEPYFALAEELDIPVGIHMGEGPPGAAYLWSPNYRARLTSPFLARRGTHSPSPAPSLRDALRFTVGG